MAASARSVLLLAALSLLLVTASASRRRPRRSPAPDVFTFGWASILLDSGRSCDNICARWGLTTVQSPANTPRLCFYNSPGAAAPVYGTWTPAGAGTPAAVTDECRGALPAGTATSNVAEGVDGYFCGCCGVISRRGVVPSCPATIVRNIASTAACGAQFSGTAFGDGTRVCLRANNAGALQYGTIDAANNCRIYGPVNAAVPFRRVCMRVNKFP